MLRIMTKSQVPFKFALCLHLSNEHTWVLVMPCYFSYVLTTLVCMSTAAGEEARELEDAKMSTHGEDEGQTEPEIEEEAGSSEEEMEDDFAEMPSFEFRFETAKLLIELDDDTTAATKVCHYWFLFIDMKNVWKLSQQYCHEKKGHIVHAIMKSV